MDEARARERDGAAPLVVGRYALFDAIAAGGMATVHLGRLLGPVGFSRTVAIKRLHQMYARDPEFASMFLDEARLVARIRHPNVVQTVDVVATNGELFIVMEYVQGESLARVIRTLSARGETMPPRIAAAVMSGVLQGLHAAHEAKDERGNDLGIVHRDVSPQNVLVGADGMARVLDFGIAKASGRLHTTRDGHVRGKLAYMAPEQVHAETITRTADIYAAAVVAWEALTARRLFKGESDSVLLAKVLAEPVPAPSELAAGISKELDAVILRGLSRDPAHRFATAREMAHAIERCAPPASLAEVAEWVTPIIGAMLAERAALVAKIESDSGVSSLEALKDGVRQALAEASLPPPSVAAAPEPTDLQSNLATGTALALPVERPQGTRKVVAAIVSAAVVALVVVIAVASRTSRTSVSTASVTDTASSAVGAPVSSSASTNAVSASSASTNAVSAPSASISLPPASGSADAMFARPAPSAIPSSPRRTPTPRRPPASKDPFDLGGRQ